MPPKLRGPPLRHWVIIQKTGGYLRHKPPSGEKSSRLGEKNPKFQKKEKLLFPGQAKPLVYGASLRALPRASPRPKTGRGEGRRTPPGPRQSRPAKAARRPR